MKRIVALMILMLAVVSIRAQYGAPVADPAPMMAALKKANNGIQSIESDFRLAKRVALMEGEQVSNGRFYYRRADNAVCFDYAEPRGNRLVMSRGQISIRTGGQQQKISAQGNPAMQQMQNMIAACFGGNFAEMSDKQSVETYADAERLTVVLTPANKRVQRYMKRIVLRFDRTDYSLASLTMEEKNGDTSEYSFSNVKTNNTLEASIFSIE